MRKAVACVTLTDAAVDSKVPERPIPNAEVRPDWLLLSTPVVSAVTLTSLQQRCRSSMCACVRGGGGSDSWGGWRAGQPASEEIIHNRVIHRQALARAG